MNRSVRMSLWGLLALLVGCGPDDSAGTRNVILAVLPTASNPFWQSVADGIGSHEPSVPPVEIKVGSADADARTQVDILEAQLAAGRVAALIVGPASSTAIVPVIAEYNTRGIPVIVVDSPLDSSELARLGGQVDAFIGSRNEQGGELAAQRLEELLGSGRRQLLILGGSPEHLTALARATGFRRAAPRDWDIHEVSANWNRAEANRAMRAALSTEKVDGVFAANDEMALGAIDALKAAGVSLAEWPAIVGFDATADAVAEVRAGRLCGTIAQDPFRIGREAVDVANELLHGTAPSRSQRTVDVHLIKDPEQVCAGTRTEATRQSP